MEFSQFRCFAALAEELHFARVVRKLGMTQSPLSRSIQKLESELGVMLFDRTNKWNVTLTDAGKVFRPEAEELLRQALAAENAARNAGKRGLWTARNLRWKRKTGSGGSSAETGFPMRKSWLYCFSTATTSSA